MRHIIPVSGKDSLTTAIVQIARAPHLRYELMYNPTGAETPEVETWLQKVESALGLPVARVGRNLEDIIDEMGMLPSRQMRFCTRLAKIYPMEDWIGNDPATVYYGIRADENRGGYIQNKKPNITPAYPLRELGIKLDDVWRILSERDLMPPLFYWPSLFETTKELLGEYAGVLDTLSRPMFYQLFAGRTRANCFFCFNQRAYEWVWLLETHPDLFNRAMEIEENTGGDNYGWVQGKPLRTYFMKNAELIKKRRARRIAKHLLPKQAPMLFSGEEEQEEADILSVVSCGLFCGK